MRGLLQIALTDWSWKHPFMKIYMKNGPLEKKRVDTQVNILQPHS